MAKSMPWIPANMTPERLRAVESFARYRQIARAEALALLIDAGIEVMRPVVRDELQARHDEIRSRLLPFRKPATGWEPK